MRAAELELELVPSRTCSAGLPKCPTSSLAVRPIRLVASRLRESAAAGGGSGACRGAGGAGGGEQESGAEGD